MNVKIKLEFTIDNYKQTHTHTQTSITKTCPLIYADNLPLTLGGPLVGWSGALLEAMASTLERLRLRFPSELGCAPGNTPGTQIPCCWFPPASKPPPLLCGNDT